MVKVHHSLVVAGLLAGPIACYKLRFVDLPDPDNYRELWALSHRNNYILSEKEQVAIDHKNDLLTPPYTEPFTYNTMRDKLTAHVEKHGKPEPYKPIEIGPGRFDPTPTAYPQNWRPGLGFNFAQSHAGDDWGSSIDVPMEEMTKFNAAQQEAYEKIIKQQQKVFGQNHVSDLNTWSLDELQESLEKVHQPKKVEAPKPQAK